MKNTNTVIILIILIIFGISITVIFHGLKDLMNLQKEQTNKIVEAYEEIGKNRSMMITSTKEFQKTQLQFLKNQKSFQQLDSVNFAIMQNNHKSFELLQDKLNLFIREQKVNNANESALSLTELLMILELIGQPDSINLDTIPSDLIFL